jgi:hypothetical protein
MYVPSFLTYNKVSYQDKIYSTASKIGMYRFVSSTVMAGVRVRNSGHHVMVDRTSMEKI